MEAYIEIPEAKPAYELIDGQLYQKMSPQTRHALLAGAFLGVLRIWAGKGYFVGPEWRFRISDGVRRQALVPDVAMVLRERMHGLDEVQYEEPPFAPDIAVEILSTGDNKKLLSIKIDAYLRNGSKAALIVDPIARTIAVHDSLTVRQLGSGDVFEHPAFPGLRIDLANMFAILDRD